MSEQQHQHGQLFADLDDLCQSDSLSEDGLRAVIERHGWTPSNPTIPYDFFLSACKNERVTEGILRYLVDNFPAATKFADGRGNALHYITPLHLLCRNKNVTLGMVQLLLDFPDLRQENDNGILYLHCLCANIFLDDGVAIDILKLLLEMSPESVRQHVPEEGGGNLPIHLAANEQSTEFCRLLIDAYPGSERIAVADCGILPFHFACTNNTVATAKYLYEIYPESINVAAGNGAYPIHLAISGLKDRMNNPEAAIDVVQFLLDCDPNVASHEYSGDLPLYWTCSEAIDDNAPTKLNAYLKILQMLYDAHPEAIESDAITSELDSFPQEIRTFINTRLVFARQSSFHRLMTTRDENGQLPLHSALRVDVDLGSIKLLVNGNPSAICTFDRRGMIPLHVACQHNDSASVVQYLIGLGEDTLDAMDKEGNTSLHYACRGGNHKTIALLLDRYGAVSVSNQNVHNQLPIDLLFESEAVGDREGIGYIESIFLLLRAYPDTINCICNKMPTQAASREQWIPQNTKKRKVDSM